MKNLKNLKNTLRTFLFITMALMLLAGCAKEDPTTVADNQQEPRFEKSFYFLNPISNELEEISLDRFDLSNLNTKSMGTTAKSNPNSKATGHVTLDGSSFSFSAMENKGGIHGQVNRLTASGNTHVDVDCIYIDGNKAYFGGIATQSATPILLGYYFYFGVEDNGEGANAPAPDRATNFPLAFPFPPNEFPGLPPFMTACEAAAFFFNNGPFPDPWVDGLNPTQVQVN